MPSGRKTWIVEYRPGAGGRKVSKRRMKIEVATKITPETARSRAKEMLARVHLGEDPAGARAASREIPTVAEFAKQFLEEAASLRRLVVLAIGAFKLDAVTCADIARLHRRTGKATPTSANNMLVTLSSMYRYAGEVGAVTKA